jgi:hypothetical protein
MDDQTTETGRCSAEWGRTFARYVAKIINARMLPPEDQRNNMCVFRGKRVAIKSARCKTKTFLIYDKMLEVADSTLFAKEVIPNNFVVYEVSSNKIHQLARPAMHQRHKRASTVSVSAIARCGKVITRFSFRLDPTMDRPRTGKRPLQTPRDGAQAATKRAG